MSGSADEDEDFERALLASARRDVRPDEAGVQDAWVRFAGALGALAPAAIGPAVSRPAAPPPRLGRLAALKWLALGAVGGAGVTAAVMSRHATAPVAAISATAAAPAPARPALPIAGPVGEPQPAGERRLPPRPHPGSAPPASTLAAEVARIDTARTAAALGDYDEAIRLVARYHRDFPRGTLAPDADVVALEAWAAQGNAAETSRLAALFLARYPNDPHAERVRRLAARQPGQN